MYSEIIDFIKSLYPNQNPVPLHSPVFIGKEKQYLNDCIDTTFVSYVGHYVTMFEEMTARYCGAKYAVATVNGTAALHVALQVAGVNRGDEVITQPLTFVATVNAISHVGAIPVFVDVDLDTMGLSPTKLEEWLADNVVLDETTRRPVNKITKRKIAAIVPMHTFGHTCRIDEIINIANNYNIPVIEDAAEALGSYYKKKHAGTFGLAGILSYNGNKTVTTGGGGMILTDDEEFAKKSRHLTTTGKLPHPWEYIHDIIAYNYRMTNLNAALGVAQMEYFDEILINKRETAKLYMNFFNDSSIKFFLEPSESVSNYWLNVIKFRDFTDRDKFLEYSNSNGIAARPIWRLMNNLKMYENCERGTIDNAKHISDVAVNIPSGYRQKIKLNISLE